MYPKLVEAPSTSGLAGLFACLNRGDAMPRWDSEGRVTAVEVASRMPDVSRHLIYLWVSQGKLKHVGKRGRSPLYRWGDIIEVEMRTRETGKAARKVGRQIAA